MPKVQSTNDAGAPPSHTPAPSDQARARLRGATVVLDDRRVLRAVDVDVVPGITVLRGPNGAGKTTALRALAGLVPLVRGTREVPFDLLYLGHRPQLLHGLTARENLRFFTQFRGPTSRAPMVFSASGRSGIPDARVTGALERWGLLADADRPVEWLSAGQRRRAALARLETETGSVVLLDEPFAELDDDAAALLRRVLDESCTRGTGILIATHGHTELDGGAARVYVLREGEIAATAG